MRAPSRFHAHVYYTTDERSAASALRDNLEAGGRSGAGPRLSYVGRLVDRPIGPHPIAQFELHFAAAEREAVIARLEASGLRALVHPLTDDDLADHVAHAHWIGDPLELDLSALDPPGEQRGSARFGKAGLGVDGRPSGTHPLYSPSSRAP